MADYRYEITTGGLDTQLEDLRTIMLDYPLVRYKISGQWRRTVLQPAITLVSLVSTSPGVNKTDLDNMFLAITERIHVLSPGMRVVLTVFQTDMLLEVNP
jgi:hypothetical protein